MTHWIGVAHRKHALIGRAQGFCAFSHGKEAAVRRLSPGDLFVYYAPREDFDGPAVQAFVALGQVAEGDPAAAAGAPHAGACSCASCVSGSRGERGLCGCRRPRGSPPS